MKMKPDRTFVVSSMPSGTFYRGTSAGNSMPYTTTTVNQTIRLQGHCLETTKTRSSTCCRRHRLIGSIRLPGRSWYGNVHARGGSARFPPKHAVDMALRIEAPPGNRFCARRKVSPGAGFSFVLGSPSRFVSIAAAVVHRR
jgi:hypothetical protein